MAQSREDSARAFGVGRHGEHIIADGEVAVFDIGATARDCQNSGLLCHQCCGRSGIKVTSRQHQLNTLPNQLLGRQGGLHGICFCIDMDEAEFFAEHAA